MSVVHRLDTLIDAVTARHGHSPMGLEMACVRLIKEQHAEIERLRTEVERLDLNGIHSCHDTCRRLPCVQRREIERLRSDLRNIQFEAELVRDYAVQLHDDCVEALKEGEG